MYLVTWASVGKRLLGNMQNILVKTFTEQKITWKTMVSNPCTSANTLWIPETSISLSSKGFRSQWDGIREKLMENQNVQKYNINNKGHTTLWYYCKLHENQWNMCACPVSSTQRAMTLSVEAWEILLAIESCTNSNFDGNQAWNLELYVHTAVMRQGPSQWSDSRRRQIKQKPDEDQSLLWLEWGLPKCVGSLIPTQWC